MAIYRGAGGAGDAVDDASSEVLLALQAKDAAQTSATNAATSATNASNSASTASTQASNAASSASAASTSASNASTSATNASNSASAASTSATNASNSASAASTSATNASNSASAASTSATNASNSASAASTSATNASNAQTAAEAARDATLTAYDNFDDRYLGSKTSDPTLDNDGNALVGGALYFNSVSGVMKVYTGSAWVAAYVSGADYLAKANNLSDLTNTTTARTNLGLGTIATQAASAVAITGGTATLTSLTTPTVQATNSGGLALKNSAGTTQMSMGGGGGDNLSINVSTNLNGTNSQIDISPTGTGHVHIKPTGSGSIEMNPTSVGTIDNMTIGATTAKNGSFVNLSVTGTTSFDGAQGTAGQVLTSAGAGNTPTWATVSGSISVTGGDLTLSGNTGTAITNATLATVNSNTGSFGSATVVPVITVNGKGLITAVSTATISSLPSQTGNSGKYLTTDGSTASWGTVSSGAVVQVKTATTSTRQSFGAGTATDLTGLTVNITPTSASNKILVIVNSWYGTPDATANYYVKLLRNGTNIGQDGGNDTAGYVGNAGHRVLNEGQDQYSIQNGNFSFVDSPSSTSALTYKCQGQGNSGTFYFNQSAAGGYFYMQSTITVMEITP